MAMVSYTWDTLPEVTQEEIDRVHAMKDEDIDYSDIPEITDRSHLVERFPRSMYKPVKVAVSCKLDADVVAWLKVGGKGYQTRLNTILRRVMISAVSREKQAAPASR